MVGVDGFEPTQPEAQDLQSCVALQLYGTPLLFNYSDVGRTHQCAVHLPT